MAAVTVLLADWEHMCCGERREDGDERREDGDTVTITVQSVEGTIYEERHSRGIGVEPQPITGVVTAIRWRPAVIVREGDYARRVDSYEPGFQVESTDYDDSVGTGWAFEFTLETEEQVLLPRKPV